jgi:hypothetical protein
MRAHAATILLAAFLLFLVQPLVGRFILPRYGGAPAVWTVALLFFQVALLAGYAYAHALTRLVPARAQAWIHGLLVLAGLAFLPVIPADAVPTGTPTLSILWLLLSSVGLPFVLLAATSPLVQAWLGEAAASPRVYRLYALSNVGSLAALLAYPFALEPWVGLRLQAWGWSAGYGLFVLATLAVAVHRMRVPAAAAVTVEPASAPGMARRVLWFGLAGCGVWMLMAVTNRMTLNIAPVPLLWVLPLGLYLLSFIAAFSGTRWYVRRLMLPALLASVVVFAVAASGTLELPPLVRIAFYGAGLLVTCLVLHGELYRLRPDTPRLTGFYLSVAGGGALGGVLVGVAAPALFPSYWEFELGQVLGVVAVLGALAVDSSSRLRGFRPRWLWAGIAVLLLLWIDVYRASIRNEMRPAVASTRSFFGVTRVTEEDGLRVMIHGTTNHGAQLTDGRTCYTYFGPGSGVGRILGREAGPRRIAIVGLGAGTMAVYGREGDLYRFYELDPDVESLARTHFTYLSASRARVEVVTGDGRLALRDEADERFDVLILDAFSSGAVPVHLLTVEAFAIYDARLAAGGVVAVNITNRNLDLAPVVAGAARARDWQWAHVSSPGDEAAGILAAEWMLLARDLHAHGFEPEKAEPGHAPWTDDFSNLFRILK